MFCDTVHDVTESAVSACPETFETSFGEAQALTSLKCEAAATTSGSLRRSIVASVHRVKNAMKIIVKIFRSGTICGDRSNYFFEGPLDSSLVGKCLISAEPMRTFMPLAAALSEAIVTLPPSCQPAPRFSTSVGNGSSPRPMTGRLLGNAWSH